MDWSRLSCCAFNKRSYSQAALNTKRYRPYAKKMNVKKELIWWTAFGLLSTLIIGTVTSFKFSRLDIQVYDTYYVFESIDGIKLLTIIFGLGRYSYLLIDIITDKYKILALIISILNAITGLFIVIMTYLSIETILTSNKNYPDIDFPGHFLLSAILLGILTVQTIIEINLIRKLNGLWTNK